ncbi:amino acid permease [Saccharopolyspora erythraea]|uniref:amino acid permease n=1 Tax=Saccharopolyspora erythraea TaxID=1836 RepID=UPI0024AF5279|nr:APC family permease [Saccharopolyspora erythraea]
MNCSRRARCLLVRVTSTIIDALIQFFQSHSCLLTCYFCRGFESAFKVIGPRGEPCQRSPTSSGARPPRVSPHAPPLHRRPVDRSARRPHLPDRRPRHTAIVAGSAILCLSFLGFDAISTLSEEAREPRKTIPRAIILCTVFCGLLFVLMSWVGHLVYPDWQTFTDPDSASTASAAPLVEIFLEPAAVCGPLFAEPSGAGSATQRRAGLVAAPAREREAVPCTQELRTGGRRKSSTDAADSSRIPTHIAV